LTTAKASKCVCDRSSALDPLRELTALPQTPYSWIGETKRTEEWRGGKGLGKGSGARGKKAREREGRGGKEKKGWKGRSNPT